MQTQKHGITEQYSRCVRAMLYCRCGCSKHSTIQFQSAMINDKVCTQREVLGGMQEVVRMSCRACRSVNQSEFPAELNIHFPGPENFETPTVWVFPRLLVCLNCGFTEFVIRAADVRRLKTAGAAEEQ